MRALPLVAALLGASGLQAQAPATHTLMPVPASFTMTSARLALDSTFTVAIVHHRDGRLERAIDRAVGRLESRTAKKLSHHYGASPITSLVVDVTAAGSAVPDLDEDESYTLDVSSSQAVLSARNVVGAIRGLETLLQLQSADAKGFFFSGAHIEDTPRFRWRGLLVDVCRHWQPVEMIKRTLDGMAVVKLNVLHWHLSEDQGFRVESKRFPRLQGLGSDGLFYTQTQIKDVVAYAADRGIRVVPEFDMPGHSTAWFVGYPLIASGPGPYTVGHDFGVFRAVMDPTRESTYQFLSAFIAEMAPLFPDRYWHIGGDEVDPTAWKASTAIQAWMKAHSVPNEHALQTSFNRRLFAILKKNHKEPVGWDEILQPDLPKAAVIQGWRNLTALPDAAKRGHAGILSTPFYLDHIQTAGEHYTAALFPPGVDLTPAEMKLVLGGEACMWGEFVSQETIDARIWPRLGAIAERFWSPADVKDVTDMYRRLEVTSRRLGEVGTLQEGHTERMVQHFAIGDDATLFTHFLDYVRPRGFGGRAVDQLSPLTRLIDAAVPDPMNGWRMLDRARRAIAGDSSASRLLHNDFSAMQQFIAQLGAVRERIPVTDDGIPAAAVLADLGRVGDQALGLMMRRETPAAGWRAGADSVLLRASDRRTYGLLRVVGADAVRLLVEAAAK